MGIRKKIEDLMSAASFAEEGDVQTSGEILRQGKRVLLALRAGRIEQKTLRYALNTSKRVEADLDILYLSPEKKVNEVLRRFFEELDREKIRYRFIQRTGCMKQEIIDYTDSWREVLFVVIESSDSLDAECNTRSRKLSESWQKLKCPLVVVSEALQS